VLSVVRLYDSLLSKPVANVPVSILPYEIDPLLLSLHNFSH
jgi:hypothetical protein